MRILRVAQKLYPDTKGGGQYHVHAMSRDQAALGHDVTVVTVQSDPDLPHIETRDGYTVIRYDPTASLLGNDISSGVAQYLASAAEFDVMHAHSHLYFSTNLAALKRRLGDIPLAITNHGLYSQSAPENVFRLYLRTLGRWTFDQADVVFCYTETDRDRVREFGVSSRIEVVSNGIDTNRFGSDGRESRLINSTEPVVLFVGRLVEGKRPSVALEALPQIKRTHPDAQLYLCGDGPLRSDLESLARELDIDDSVHFLGHVPYDEMPRVYRSGDVLVLPSRAEGVPRTVLEAISTGLPVVCSHLDQLEELVAGRGELVDLDAGESIAPRVSEWLETGQRVRSLEDDYAWQTTVERTTAHLRSIAY
ncbi:glycosyltransferase family 4 protein [Natrinema longum]|uniref:Glycosyltransferase family 4 protein n=1 Tax=Natrinema longum TaxID=370324 RepID=A0A8A2UAH7_9EURY|nr:glycosyltransferase family 4 protein [Natrinema longum]MBZ6496467.1 glycosyltransferase family 4 protein [Natrinema longum]QSW85627.1 glycosyltransferase family 4 protein [Natrinema longum]